MRKESIPNSSVIVHWRDEREGRALVREREEWEALAAAYSFDPVPAAPEKLENERYQLIPNPELEFPALVRVQRKPQGQVQEAAWHFAAETSMARIEVKQGELGVHFLDEDNFIPFTKLDYLPGHGFRMNVKGESAQAPTSDSSTEEPSLQPVPPAEQVPPLAANRSADDSPVIDRPRRRARRLPPGRFRARRLRKPQSEAKPENEPKSQADVEETSENGEP